MWIRQAHQAIDLIIRKPVWRSLLELRQEPSRYRALFD
jgi:hypothetical protein